MNGAERRCPEICDSSPVRTHAQSRADVECRSRRYSVQIELQIAIDDRTTSAYAPVDAESLPGCFRRWIAHTPTFHATTAPTKNHSYQLTPLTATSQELLTTCYPDRASADHSGLESTIRSFGLLMQVSSMNDDRVGLEQSLGE